ncbi:antitoxin Xre/MbcA/ParS toxin-binding domain-containing protein [Sphingomonas canadensis]|uniref:Antitoxin Xre/MbcA/ParS toxin-binding domain-containing protein n=1 Tax=Sphingomonas canadensis TaxID=1219257 RepID=A0ABW3H4R2_9SPHN|nr:antitoxin Xre/MbcA/ParS toxin-binding domain-containing protein [Sphingomonas canadensis]MCW3836165.1 DUF2384 domain-containing protein [Sphingomonas canadensis]
MTGNQPPAPPSDDAARPKRQQFRNKFRAVRISPDGAERQSRIALLAWNQLGADAAIAFLNSHNDGLGGRPLDLAVASAAGCEAVERAIQALREG